MAIFGGKKKKDEGSKTSPPQRDLANGRFEAQNQPPATSQFGAMSMGQHGLGVNAGSMGMGGDRDREKRLAQPSAPAPAPLRSGGMQGGAYPQGPNGAGPRPPLDGNFSNTQAQRPPTQMAPNAAPPPKTQSTSSSVIYPWSHRRLGMIPPIPFPNEPDSRGSASMRPSPAPFPRYGHSVNAMAGSMQPDGNVGDLYIFGGLVGDQIRNDLHVLQVAPLSPGLPPHAAHNQVLSVGLVETRGEIPRPRIGHASVGVGNVLIIWGGDTKTATDNVQDPGLYLLNLTTREWTRVKVAGSMPEGRYGHAAAIVGSRFFVFGGQTDDGGFMNDLWGFDLQKLKTGAPKWSYLELPEGAPCPSKRTGHTIVTHNDFIYLFGGTDGNYHYNDVWRFDTNTGAWKELDCIGFIPMPREGHAATLVDDVMYILGGRGIDAKDLDDLAAFKISNQRWYMFQNMGPAPAGRSGHSMVSWQNKVYVLGGESYTAERPDDPHIVHVLDTNKIKYPTDTGRKAEASRNTMRQSAAPVAAAAVQSEANARNATASPSGSAMGQRSPPSDTQSPQLAASARPEAPRAASPTLPRGAMAPMGAVAAVAQSTDPRAPSGPEAGLARRTMNGMPTIQPSSPPRLRKEDGRASSDNQAPTAASASARAMSPVQSLGQSTAASMTGSPSVRSIESASSQARAISPVQRAVSPTMSFQARMQSSPVTQPGAPVNGIQSPSEVARATASGVAVPRGVRSPSPVQTDDEVALSQLPTQTATASQARLDAGRPEQAIAFPQLTPGSSSIAASSQTATPTNVSAARQLEWLKAALALAVQQGFATSPSGDRDDDAENLEALETVKVGDHASMQRRLVSTLLALKQELAAAKASLNDQAQQLDERLADAQNGRLAALQEASFYRAKMAAYESGSSSDLIKVDRERIEDLEQKLSQAVVSKTAAERQASQMATDLEHERSARAMLEERASTAALRAETAEAAHTRLVAEHSDLQTKSLGFDTSLQTHLEKIMTLQSAHAQLQADHDHQRSRATTAEESNAQYVSALQQMQTTLLAANAKADEMHDLWATSKSELDAQKEENLRLVRDIESRTSDADAAAARIEDLSRILRTTQEENEALRALTSGTMAELVASTRSVQSADIGSSELHRSKSRAIEEEVNNLRSLHQQSVSRLEASGSELAVLKARNIELERHLIASRSEVDALRARHASALQDAGRVKAQIAARDLDLRNKSRAAEAAELKAGLLRSLMAENGLTVDDDYANRSLESIMSNTDSPEQLARRVQELESRLEQRSRSHRELETTHDETVRELRDTEDRFREASRKHEAAADEISSLVQEVQRLRSGGATSVTHSSEAHGRAEEDLAALQERHHALEATHLKAVQYVKGTEKMLRRMKEELSKYKERNEQLETELASRGGEEPSGDSAAKRSQLEALQTQINNLRTSSEKARTENEDLQRHIVSLQSEYAQRVSHQEEEASSRYSAYDAEVRRLKELHSQAQKDLEAAAQLNRSLNEKVLQHGRTRSSAGADDPESHKQLETSLIQAQKQSERLKQENAELEARCKDAEAKISLLLEHIDNTTSNSSHEHRFEGEQWSDSRRGSAALESEESDYTDGGGDAVGAGHHGGVTTVNGLHS